MKKPRLFWQLFPSYLLIMLLALGAATWYASRTLRQAMLEHFANNLLARAHLVANHVAKDAAGDDAAAVQALARQLGDASDTRITIVRPDGLVLGDSSTPPAEMENHADRPEIRDALAGDSGRSTRPSPTLQQQMMYVAVPIRHEGKTVGVSRAALSLSSIDKSISSVYAEIAVGGAVAAAIAGMISYLVSRAISRPLVDMTRAARRFTAGDLKARLPLAASAELSSLAETINRAAAELDVRIQTITRQRNEHEAILASMAEGVVAVDSDERIISINRTGGHMLDAAPSRAVGQTIQEAVRNPELQKFVARALEASEPVEADIEFRNGGEKLLRAHGAVLNDAAGEHIGVVIVLNDVTRIRRLETLRRDFVANVSHELKTPITSIKGFVETLIQDPPKDPAEADRFLQIIARHADRLTAIIEDLLLLSKIEQEQDDAPVEMQPWPVMDVLQPAVQACEARAAVRGMHIRLTCPDDLSAVLNAQLIEQAVINLIDNAAKYGDEGTDIQVEAEQADDDLLIRVSDHSPGIDDEQLPRLFERFYRIDKGRSRAQGGTGLGLAIVKHIAQAHRGAVSAESRRGVGSVFTIHLPIRPM